MRPKPRRTRSPPSTRSRKQNLPRIWARSPNAGSPARQAHSARIFSPRSRQADEEQEEADEVNIFAPDEPADTPQPVEAAATDEEPLLLRPSDMAEPPQTAEVINAFGAAEADEVAEVAEPAPEPGTAPQIRPQQPENIFADISDEIEEEEPLRLGADHRVDPEEAESDVLAEARASLDAESAAGTSRFSALLERIQSGQNREAPQAGAPGDHGAGGAVSTSDISAAEFAEMSGAETVADLLAASAAWLTLSGDKPRFSRREVMDVFDTLPGDHPRR